MQTSNNSTAFDQKADNPTAFDQKADILISGYLQKKCGFYRTITRWIVIQDNYLYSYKNKNAQNPTKIIDLRSYIDIIFSNNEKQKYFELISLDGEVDKRYYFPNNSSHNTQLWIDIIDASLISPTTPTQEVFQRIYNSLGYKSDNWLKDFNKKLNKFLNDLWCYRAIDLLHMDKDLWNTLHIPIVVQNKLFTYMNRVWQKQKSFTQFQETICNTKNIIPILDALATENKSKSTLDNIKYLKQLFRELCALNIDKIKQFFIQSDWDNMTIPQHLKNILIKKIYINNSRFEEKKYEPYMLNNYNVDPTLTIDKLIKSLANSLFVSIQCIKTCLTPFIPYKYDRLYHLAGINDDLYNKLMSNAPTFVRLELHNVIMVCRKQMELMEGKSFNIPKLKVHLFKTDPTTAIIDILNVYEEKFNAYAQFVDLNTYNISESIEFDDNNTHIICKHLTPNKEYKIRMQYKNDSGFLCCSKIKSFMTLPNAPILDYSVFDITDSTITVKLEDPNIEWHVEIAEVTDDIATWKPYIKTNALAFQLISDLKCDSGYQIIARYKNKSGLSAYSDAFTIKTKLPKPPTFSFYNIKKNSVAIKFDHAISSHLNCCIKITLAGNNSSKVNEKMFSVSNVNKFYCDNLKQNTKYNIKAYYPKYKIFTETKTFETRDCMTKQETKELKELINNYTNYEYKKKWKLLYRGSKHGFNAKSFYNKCDMKQNTICIIRTDENEIFGAFTSLLWDKSKMHMGNNKRELQKDSNAFMFSVRSNKLSKPLLFPVSQKVGYERGYFWIFDSERFKIYLKDNCNLNCLSTKTMFECGCYNQPFKVKEIEVYQLFERIRKHNKGNKFQWRNESIENWTHDDVLHYMTNIFMNDYWYYKIISVIKDCNVNGADLMELQSPKEIGEALHISKNPKLCNELFAKIMLFACDVDSVSDDEKRDEDMDKFSINIFHQKRHIVLNEMVRKETKVSYIKKLYKLETGVKAAINDIHFYCRLKEMCNNQRLEDINIIDERHIISVKFGVNAGKNN